MAVWDLPQPCRISGWTVMDAAGGGFIAFRRAPGGNTDNVVGGPNLDVLRREVARAEGITVTQLDARESCRRELLKGDGLR
ncbi:hypothetical protein GCM10009560_62190 [Nonomuraea longicatena]|uniref:Uncharacterized protein n=1 Tax=Nonomuraea longicatena TaxID=83682 RepID=A0ABP4B856_9ACTN